MPNIESSPTSKTEKVGLLAVLTCKCNGQPLPKISWLLDNQLITDSLENVSIVNTKSTNGIVISTLELASIQTSRAGVYTCVATNRVGSESVRAAVNVEGISKYTSLS